MSAETEVGGDRHEGGMPVGGRVVGTEVRPVGRPRPWLPEAAGFSVLDDPTTPAEVVVEQVGDKVFRVPAGCGFQYNPPGGGTPYRVDEHNSSSTDFASIPRYMSWFVSRYGRHTPAALVHDTLVVDGMSLEARVEADRLFLEMLNRLAVPAVQARVMWAAVTAATRMSCATSTRLATMAWGAIAAVGTVALVGALVAGAPVVAALLLLLPVPAALLWGRQWVAGLIAGYAVPFVVVPGAASLVGYWCYWLVEKAVKLARQLVRRRRPEAVPEYLPEPAPLGR